MAIGMVEMQGMINRTQDYQQLQQFENERGMIFQTNQQTQVEQNVEEQMSQVHEKTDANEDTEADGKGSGSYSGDGGRKRKQHKPQDRVVEKSTMAFDIKI